MYNLRYHIASLVAVFMALSVGLLLGTAVVQTGVLQKQKTTLLGTLNSQYSTLRTANSDLKTQNDALGAFAEDALPQLLRGALAGKTIVILTDPVSTEALRKATEAIVMAGGTPAVVTLHGPGLDLSSAQVRDAAMASLGTTQASVLTTSVVEGLAGEWVVAGTPRPLTAALSKAGAMRVQGLTTGAKADGVVVLSSWDGAPDGMAVALAKVIERRGSTAVGAETMGRATGMPGAAASAGLSSVDDLETPMGRLSLVWVMAGRATGRFGTGVVARDPFPQPLYPATQ